VGLAVTPVGLSGEAVTTKGVAAISVCVGELEGAPGGTSEGVDNAAGVCEAGGAVDNNRAAGSRPKTTSSTPARTRMRLIPKERRDRPIYSCRRG